MGQWNLAADSRETPVRVFPETHWSVVLAAGGLSEPNSARALEQLCGSYWYPIYGYLRRMGKSAHDSQDLAQSFFVHLLNGPRLQSVHPTKGKFRSFLLASLKNFVNNDYDREHRLKRGGQFVIISVDEALGEERFQQELGHNETPDKAFEQSWAMVLLDDILLRLREEYAREQKRDAFEVLSPYLSGDRSGAPYSETAARLEVSEASVKMSVLRLRRRFGELLRLRIAETVTSPEEVDEEIRCLFAAINAG
jgi:RNA polymerase sigma factor (sigma-70 family)